MKKTRLTQVCEHCSKSFEVKAYLVRNGGGKYCSRACYQAHRWEQDGKCKHCGKKSVTRFCSPDCQKAYWNRNGYVLQKKRRLWERKLEIITELGGKCARCGNADLRVLDLHHIDPTKKVIPKNRQYTWLRRLADWKKNKGNLELICANCHRIHTWDQLGFQKVNGNDIWD